MTDHKAQLAMLLAMPQQERKVYLLYDKVKSETYWLDSMLEDWKQGRTYTIEQIRNQRKRVQVWQKRLSEARVKLNENEQNAKLSQSSSHSTG